MLDFLDRDLFRLRELILFKSLFSVAEAPKAGQILSSGIGRMKSLQIKLIAPKPTQINQGTTLNPHGDTLKATPVKVTMMNWRTRIPKTIGR